jgi:hypothetical protein
VSANPQGLLLEALHSAGYSGALAKPLMASESAVNRLDVSILEEFVAVRFSDLFPKLMLSHEGVSVTSLLAVINVGTLHCSQDGSCSIWSWAWCIGFSCRTTSVWPSECETSWRAEICVRGRGLSLPSRFSSELLALHYYSWGVMNDLLQLCLKLDSLGTEHTHCTCFWGARWLESRENCNGCDSASGMPYNCWNDLIIYGY